MISEKDVDLSVFEEKSGLLLKIESVPSFEEKIAIAIDFMKEALSQVGSPDFKLFWEAKKICLPFFKENINSLVRSKLWTTYIELSEEARRLKSMRDEESSFASEQIELALNSIEKELGEYDVLKEKMERVRFPEGCRTIEKRIDFYETLQRELNLLNAFAGRISSLRKEIVKREVFLKNRGRFFKKLSALGDKVFPRRKELIKDVSLAFVEDIEAFSQRFNAENGAPGYILRQEIKDLQNIAKILTLNSLAFNSTRLKLSECWNSLKEEEKERKKEMLDRKKQLAVNAENIKQKVDEFAKEKEGKSKGEIDAKVREFIEDVEKTELAHQDVDMLKEDIQNLKGVKKEKSFEVVRKEIEETVGSLEKIQEFEEGIVRFSGFERDVLEHLLQNMRDVFFEKKRNEASKKKDLDTLSSVLEYEIEAREKSKEAIERYRKAMGQSGFDFEKAITYREMLDMEKKRLKKIAEVIDKLEN